MKKIMKQHEKLQKYVIPQEDELMYRFLLVGIPVAIFVYFIIANVELGPEWMQQCLFHEWTGMYCLGCGATRAVAFFLQGKWIQSVVYYPAVLPVGIFVILYMVRNTLCKVTNGKIRGMHYRKWYIFVPVGLIVLNCIWKNYYYLVKRISLIP